MKNSSKIKDMFGRRNNLFMYAAIAAVVGYFVKDKLPSGIQNIYQKIEEKLKGDKK